jgi:DNA repair protein RadC
MTALLSQWLRCRSGNRPLRTLARAIPLRGATLSESSVDRSLVPVPETLNAVLRHDGRALAVAHNHLGGADRRATDDVKAAARTAGLRFLGHVIVAGAEWRALS